MLEAQLQGEQWLKDLFDHAHDLIQIVHIDGTLLYVNKSWFTLLEYSRDEILGKPLYLFIAEADRSRYAEYRSQVIDGNLSKKPIVFQLRAKSGKLISVEGMVSVKLEEGKPLYTRGIFRDISVRLQNEAKLKQLNQELLKRERNLQQLLIHAPDAVIVITKESRISFWNPKAEAIFGWRESEVINQPLQFVIIPLQYREAHEKGMKRYLATGEGPVLNKTIEITALKKTGEEFYVSLTISPTSQNGETAFIAFIRDITEQKHNQLELEKKTKELEQFTHVSHHDLQEPLRKITMFTDIIKSEAVGKLSEGAQQKLEKVSDAARRMSVALRDVLNFASLSKEEDFSEVDLGEVLAAVVTDLELVITEKRATVNITPLPVLKAIPQQMHQLFYNLVNNALKFSKTDVAPVVNITSQKLPAEKVKVHGDISDSKSYYEIVVQDNGIGFNQEAAHKIFGMFQRLHSKNTYAGTGIGLALVKKVVENHQGKIWADGKEGEGATFNVLLPAE